MLELGGAVVSVLDWSDREDVRLHQPNASVVDLLGMYITLPPLLVAMHHMILCVRRNFFEITTIPNTLIQHGLFLETVCVA
mgnify:CR=1 FL=1